jgi:hypothetical protein
LGLLTAFWGHGRRLKIGCWVGAENWRWDDGPAGMTDPPGITLPPIDLANNNHAILIVSQQLIVVSRGQAPLEKTVVNATYLHSYL